MCTPLARPKAQKNPQMTSGALTSWSKARRASVPAALPERSLRREPHRCSLSAYVHERTYRARTGAGHAAQIAGASRRYLGMYWRDERDVHSHEREDPADREHRDALETLRNKIAGGRKDRRRGHLRDHGVLVECTHVPRPLRADEPTEPATVGRRGCGGGDEACAAVKCRQPLSAYAAWLQRLQRASRACQQQKEPQRHARKFTLRADDLTTPRCAYSTRSRSLRGVLGARSAGAGSAVRRRVSI